MSSSLNESEKYENLRPKKNLLKGSIFDYSDRQHIPYFERRYPIDEYWYRTDEGEAQFQIDKREYEEAERAKFKKDKNPYPEQSHWSNLFKRKGGKRRTRKAKKSRKSRKARKSRRR
jgi:hypothetical protein